MENNTIITGIISPIIALVPTIILVWKSHESKKSPLAVRIIRKKGEIAKAELANQTKMERLKLELATLEEEANYQNRMNKWESGEVSTGQTNELTNQLNDLKEKGEAVVQKGTEQVKQSLNILNSLKNKGSGVVKGISDQIKGLKDKIPNPLKKE